MCIIIKNLRLGEGLKIFLLIMFFTLTLFADDVYYYEYGKKVQLTKLKENRSSNVVYYENSAGQKIGVKNQVLVKCESNDKCKKIFDKYNLTEIENLTSSIVLIKLKQNEDPFELSQKLYLEDGISIAHPNFVKKRHKR